MSNIPKQAIASFLLAVASCSVALCDQPMDDSHIHLRGSLENSRLRFKRDKEGHVAFIGGSITEMNGYRPMVMDVLKRRFPKTQFAFTNAGISSTCSTTGAFRVFDHVLNKSPVDMLFVEFAVNDDQDAGHARRECIRGLEGVIRRTREHSPNADIVVTYFVNPGMLTKWQAGDVPLSADAHNAVVKHYKVSTINLAHEVADQITAKKLTWKQFGGTHPAPYGNAIATAMIDRLMELAWDKPLAAVAKSHALPEPLDPNSYYRGRLVAPTAATDLKGMGVKVPSWKDLKGSSRERFTKEELLCGDEPGSELTLQFEGTAIGAYVLAGPDAGIVETSVDGGEFKETNLFHRFSKGLHYPRTVIFDADLKPGSHTLRLRIADSKHSDSIGHAIRVLNFVAN